MSGEVWSVSREVYTGSGGLGAWNYLAVCHEKHFFVLVVPEKCYCRIEHT